MVVRHTDGLSHVNLADMDMDKFREWLWPGVIAKSYMVEVRVWNQWQMGATVFPSSGTVIKFLLNPIKLLRPGWYRAWLYSSSEEHAKRKAIAVVRDHLTKSHGTCAMTTGEYDAKE